jgi:protein TonB
VALQATAHVKFKEGYNRYMRNAFIAAVAFHVLMVVMTPRITYKPFVLREQYLEAVELPTSFELPPPPKEVSAPVVPIEAASDEEADAEAGDIAPTSFTDLSALPPPPPPPSEQAQEFYAFDEAPVLIKFINPKYPDLARQAGIEGTVLLNVLVGDDGKVLQVTVIQSDVTPAMEKTAMEAAKQFMFKPAKQRTVAVKARVAIPIRFKLHGG